MNKEEKKAVEFVKNRTKELKKYAKRENELVYDDIILNLINKLQKENEKLQKENEELKIKNNAIKRESEAYAENMIRLDIEKQDYFEKYRYHLQQNESLTKEFSNVIPIQKVKDKIEELNKKEQELQNSVSNEEREEYSDANISWNLMDIEIRREVLQELIEEKGKE